MTRDGSYSVADFGAMINSTQRTKAYADALRRAVTPGCRVIDIGTGPGLFAVLACKFGAGSVVAIDPNDAIELVMPIARANGCEDRIEIFKGLSTDYEGEPADVIISDLRGILPFFEAHIPSIVDARQRLLLPGGKLIPSRDIIRVAVVTAAKDYQFNDAPWDDNSLGLDLSPGRRHLVNSFGRVRLEPDALLSDPRDFMEIDFHSIVDPNLEQSFDIPIERPGLAHGLILWFDAELDDANGFSNAPGQPRQIYGQTLFPFERPVEARKGDSVVGEIAALFGADGYLWSWKSRFLRNGEPLGIDYRQSTFLAKIFDPASLQARSAGAVPRRRDVHDALATCVGLIDGQRTLDEIAEELFRAHPAQFNGRQAALDFAAAVAAREHATEAQRQ